MSSSTLKPDLARWLDALADIGEAVGGDEPVIDLVDRVARTACDLLGYDFCAVFLPTEDRRALTIVGSHGLSPDYVAQVNADRPILLDVRGAEEAPTSVAFRTGEVVTLEDIETMPGIGPWGGVAHEQGYRALVSVPLRRAGAVVGALNGYSTGPHRFDAVEIGLVTTLASQVAVALGTAQLRSREQDTIRELRRAEEVHALLTATALRGEGVAGVANALAELLARPVLIEDVYGGALADVGWPDGVAGMVADVSLGGEVVARVRVAAGDADLSPLDVRAVEHATVVTALELLRARTAAQVEQRLRGSLVADLLSTDGADMAALLDRARRLGWDLSGAQALIGVRAVDPQTVNGRTGTERLLAGAERFAATVTPRPLAAVYRGDLVLIVAPTATLGGAGGVAAVARRLVDHLTEAGDVDRPVAGVTPAVAAVELPDMLRTLRGALDLAADSASESTSAVIDLRDVAIDHLLLQLDDPQRLRDYARTVLGPAIDYDREHSSELLRTARVLLERDLDRRSTAEALHLHPNTVAQRMRRLEALTGLRPTRPRDLLQLTSALTVSRIAGLG
ncbi:GAF domain-containing protein [Mycobacterium sp. GA-2829]|uniref:helix-turn-helix domain-containing protein n=1 Tax=Mycobacterium sp. GA-2829 TaxID=1772283 RepID=UPI0009EC2A44|nr:GAF domain-containing protein [Mycobacterium sp. GA-2829]